MSHCSQVQEVNSLTCFAEHKSRKPVGYKRVVAKVNKLVVKNEQNMNPALKRREWEIIENREVYDYLPNLT